MLRFHHGTMSAGKSMLALATAHALSEADRSVLLLTRLDRSDRAMITSRAGMSAPAVSLDEDDDLTAVWHDHGRPGHVVIDEAQFLSPRQVDELADLADRTPSVEVEAYGLLTDFRDRLFPGSCRLVEVADELVALPLRARCWCGRPGNVNARIVDGRLVTDGPQVLVGDTAATAQVHYRVLCRAHFREAAWQADHQPSLDV